MISAMIDPVATYHQPSPASRTTISRFSQCRPGSVSGFDEMRPFSLPHATSDPVNVTAPMKTPR